MWREYFNRKAEDHQGSPKASDYFSDKSFYDQRRSVLDWLGPIQNERVLDAGCGVGAFSQPLAENNDVLGVDLAETALRYARRRGIHAVCADLDRLPFAERGFDLVLCIGVLQLVTDEQSLLAALHAQVKPGGTLLVQTLNQHSLQRKVLSRFAREKSFDRLFAPEQLRRTFERLGMTDIELLYWYFPLSLTTRSTRASFLSTSFAIRGRRAA
jgi:2-polyprenyl-3-methyl-5-hydroxy-6-metoxy-1,4-benzoquinol methylase